MGRAFVRDYQRLARELDCIGHANLQVRVGDLGDAQAVEDAVEGAEAVVSLACSRPENAPGPMATAVPAMVQGCRRHGVRKLIIQACALSAVPGERWGFLTAGRLARSVVQYQQASTILADHERVFRY